MILQPAVIVMEAAVLDIGESVTQKAEAVVSYRDVNEPIFKKTLWQLSTIHHSSSMCSPNKHVFLFF